MYLREGILSGEAAIREVAACLIDEDNFYSVPPTTFIELLHPYFTNSRIWFDFDAHMKWIGNITEVDTEKEKYKMIPNKAGDLNELDSKDHLVIKHGSLQQFIDGAEEAGNFGYKMFPDE